MTALEIETVVTANFPGLFVAAALDTRQRPVRSFISPWPDEESPLRLEQISPAVIHAAEPTQGGYFLRLESDEIVFLAAREPGKLTLGQRLNVECIAEARHGKQARVRATERLETSWCAFRSWRDGLGQGELTTYEDHALIDALLHDVAQDRVVLDGGGRIQLSATPALTAVDVDSAGRASRGSAGARALALNRIAAVELARQIALRDLGGLFVVDLVAPINANAGEKIRDAFLATFTAVSHRKVTCLRPSRLGLMELSVERGARPLPEFLTATTGHISAEWAFLRLLREAERTLHAHIHRFFLLRLSKPLFRVYLEHQSSVQRLLGERFSGRLEILEAPHEAGDEIVPK